MTRELTSREGVDFSGRRSWWMRLVPMKPAPPVMRRFMSGEGMRVEVRGEVGRLKGG